MRSFGRYCVLALTVFAQVDFAYADPFEVRGYRQGMSFQQVQRRAVEQGHTLRRENQNPDRIMVLQGDMELVNLGLCDDRVFNALWLVQGGLDRFVKQMESLTKQGLRKADVSWRSDIGYDGREHFDLSVYFIRPGSEKDYSVTATLFASEQHGTTNFQVSWNARNGYCK